ncbi:hypothetical protein LGR54_15155 [Ancylobacter sp. Lp-2]|uniref:hypothetical protein n=1 Tax=Ancylobacter sp. Lp-2 TaxID=2881339 RepID=UPI001E283DE4|nr:hypothetical protein [Ancylobacter sp. Lp-2]
MDSLLRLLLRFVLVPFGLVCALIVSVLVMIAGSWRVGDILAGTGDIDAIRLFDAAMISGLALSGAALMMWAVALIGVLFAEMFGVRSWLFHVANGAISAWLGAQLFPPFPEGAALASFDVDLYILGAGLAGGLAYWLVAGWSAGFWKPVFAERTPAPPAAPLPPAQPVPPPQPLPQPLPVPEATKSPPPAPPTP